MIRVFVMLCMLYIFVMPIVFLACVNRTIYYKIKEKLVNIGLIKPQPSPLKLNFNMYLRPIR